MMNNFAYPSYRSLYIRSVRGGLSSNATGFVVQSPRGPVLITNRHVVTGTDNFTGKFVWNPDALKIMHHEAGRPGQWVERTEPLLHDDRPLWVEHPTLGIKADFVALPLTQLDGVEVHTYEVKNPWFATHIQDHNPEFLVGPADVVSIIGFPFGKSSSGFFPIWVSGFVASEASENHLGLPIQLVDSRTRTGQSGSPVVAYRPGGTGVPTPGEEGTMTIFSGAVGKFLGIYSGRTHPESDIGMVWKASAIAELLQSM